MDGCSLFDFRVQRPPHEIAQASSLERVVAMHVGAELARGARDEAARASFEHRLRKIVVRGGCQPSQIRARGYSASAEELASETGASARMALYEREVARLFDALYDDGDAPTDLVHVTCTGYVAPSGAQALVAKNGWGERTRVTHAYHMGCYAAIPALRIAEGCLATSHAKSPRVDVVHTELCTLHMNALDHAPETLVVQTLFADGCVRYSASREARPRSLRVVATSERIVPDSGDAMRWVLSDHGLDMTLARDLPERIGGALRPFVGDLLARAELTARDLARLQFAVHPGGPRIIDSVREALEIEERQVTTSREVLLDHGNMSSATLPHVWKRMLADPAIAPGTPIVSLAFGPGVTLAGAVFVKS